MECAAVASDPVISGLKSNSTLSSAGVEHEYEVFLSFRGEDTGKGFTDHLYHRMIDDGIQVFKDNVDLPVGQEIGHKLFEGIKKSKIAIPIFSKNYASSKWCLNELAFMVECRKEKNQMVLPVFYDVTPHQVRHQTGTYAKAFSEHAQKYNEDTIMQWKSVLAEVGQLKGWHLENETAGREGELTKMIVAKVLVELKKAHLLVTDKLVGIDKQERAVRDLLDMSIKDVRIVGIWGMGGIGKTTLAKFIYNQIVDQFDRCSFLKDIRETSLQRNGLERLQSQLVSDLSKQARQDFSSIDEGMYKLKRRFTQSRVLVLLDDVDQVSQLDALAGELEWFGPGSRIILTTRNRDVLDNLLSTKYIPPESCAYYEVKQLSKDRALQLFCKHAFRQGNLKDEFSGLSHDVVETTGGLPLALEVIGSLLCGKRRPIWEHTLHKLKQAPTKKVQDSLKISYDMLDDEQKQMFLDVACLFIGEDVDTVLNVWEERGYRAETGKNVLLRLCLIKVDDDNRIWIHDQLRDLGREIVRKENIEPGKRSRLCYMDEARHVLEKQMGTPSIEALCLHNELGSDNYFVTKKQLMKLSNLRFLRLYNADLTGDLRQVLRELRWLRWRCSNSQSSTRTNLYVKKLLVLDLSFSRIRDDWKCWSSLQKAVKLKVLNLSSCTELTTTPNFSMLINLERLILDECSCLEVIHASVGKLNNLIVLSLKDCWMVEELPISSHMTKLVILHARGCVSLARLPESIGQLTSLVDLNLASCPITELPVGSLTNLQRLSLANTALQELPDSIGNLKSLTELDLSGTEFSTLPNSIGNLKDLKILETHKSGISRLPDDLGALQVIAASSYGNLRERISKRFSTTVDVNVYLLKVYTLNGFEALQELEFFGGYFSERQEYDKISRRLNLTGCEQITELLIPCGLRFLKSLSCSDCYNLKQLRGLGGLEALQRLVIQGCRGLEKLSSLSNLKSLRRLDCSECQELREIEGIDGLEALEELNIKYCKAVEKLSSLSNVKSLRRLDCSGCQELREIEGIAGLEALEELDIGCCKVIEKLPEPIQLEILDKIELLWM